LIYVGGNELYLVKLVLFQLNQLFN